MFNPKQALERIRKTKHEQANLLTDDNPTLSNSIVNTAAISPLSDPSNLNARLEMLEQTVVNLTHQLNNSIEQVTKLARDKNELQTQVLKLEYDNSQLRSSQRASQLRSEHKNSFNSQIPFTSQSLIVGKSTQLEARLQPVKSVAQIIESFSPQIGNVLTQLANEPMDNILKRKEKNFRALKSDNRAIQSGNRYLSELAAIQKQYSQAMTKPTITLCLNADDFE